MTYLLLQYMGQYSHCGTLNPQVSNLPGLQGNVSHLPQVRVSIFWYDGFYSFIALHLISCLMFNAQQLTSMNFFKTIVKIFSPQLVMIRMASQKVVCSLVQI
jgi:hypothetical protein